MDNVLKILLVEDNPDHALLTKETLGQAGGFAVDVAASGVACLEKLSQDSYALILLDYSLPKANGLEVMRAIKREGYETPVIMVTGQGDERVAVEAMKEGAYDYIIKAGDYLVTLPLVVEKAIEKHQLVVEHRRMEQDILQRNRELATLNAIAAAVSQSLDLEQILNDALDRVLEAIGVEAGGIRLVDEEAQETVLTTAFRGISQEFLQGVARMRLDEGVTGQAIRSGETLLIENISEDPRLSREVVRCEGLRALAIVPLKVKGRVLGIMYITTHGDRQFTAEDSELLTAIGNQMGVAIENARLYESQRQQLRRLEGLAASSQRIMAKLDLASVLEEIVAQALTTLEADRAAIFLLDRKTDRLSCAYFHSLSPEYVDEINRRYREVPGSRVLDSPEPVHILDAQTDPATEAVREAIIREGFHTYAVLPLVSGGEVTGALALYRDAIRPFDPEVLALAQSFANQAAIAIENARLYKEAKGYADKLAALYETGKDITSTLELGALLQLIAERTARLTGADKGLILLVDTEAEKLTRAVGFGFAPGQIEGFTYQEVQDGISGWVLRERTPTISEDILTDPRNTGLALERAKKEREGGKSIAVAPLTIKGELIGTLTVVNNVGKPVFSQGDLDLVVMLASQAAIAIENARLYEEAQQRSREVDTLNTIVQALNASLDVRDVFQVMAMELKRLIEFDRASIALPDQALQNFTMYALVDQPDAPLGEGVTMPIAGSAAGRDALAGRPHLTRDLSTELDFPAERLLYDAGLRSRVIVPLMVGERLIGTLNLASTQPAAFSERDLGLLQQVAGAIAAALENARLFEETERLKAFNEGIVQGMEEGIMVEDAEGCITFVNPKMAEMLGYTEEELTGKHWSETVAPSCLRQVEEESSKRLKGVSSRYEAALLRKDGKEVPGLISARPLFHEGRFVGRLSVFTDLTDIKEMEQQLIQAEKLAAIGQLTAGVAHELNNPLTTVVGLSELLQDADCSQEIKKDLMKIHNGAMRCKRIVQDLLTFARRRELRRKHVSINHILESTLAFQAPLLEADNVEVVTELEEELPLILADPYQLQQVFVNIIRNAHQAMVEAHGRGKLIIKSQLISRKSQVPGPETGDLQPGTWIRVKLMDDGPGIPPEIMGKIFDPFFTTKEVGEGTGLGLSVCLGIIREHGGNIYAESVVGEGATFIVELPVRRADHA